MPQLHPGIAAVAILAGRLLVTGGLVLLAVLVARLTRR